MALEMRDVPTKLLFILEDIMEEFNIYSIKFVSSLKIQSSIQEKKKLQKVQN
jgi:hypothetical protein